MKLKMLLLGGLVAIGSIGVVPVPAHATDCVPATGIGTVDTKVVGHTCTDCGWIMVRGEAYTLFYCD